MNYLQKKMCISQIQKLGEGTIDIMSITQPTPASNLSIFLGKNLSNFIVKIIISYSSIFKKMLILFPLGVHV